MNFIAYLTQLLDEDPQERSCMYKKKEIPITMYSDHEEMLDEIVFAYGLPDK